MFFDRAEAGSTAKRALLAFILSALLVGAAGSLSSEPALRSWYADLYKPSFAPPDWVFAPVWTALYVLMGVAAWRVWKKASLRSLPIYLYGVQLALNLGWTCIFFGLHAIGAAFGEILLLFVLVAATGLSFWNRDRIAGLLFLPYLAWVGFAAALNYRLYELN